MVVDDSGTVKSYCVYDAPSEDIVRGHAKELGQHDVQGIYEIAGDVTPEDSADWTSGRPPTRPA